ncbi:hypothetical protein SRABI70_04737 [Pseudomonas sp. Bi70]|nr:hypothetical protein SRABI70_04737 [Pseudomonas sp. Bi70]
MTVGLAAHRVGIAGIAGEHEGLAAAAAEILFLFIARAARLGHPGKTAIAVEAERVVPDMLQAVLAHVGKGDRQLARAMAGQGGAVRGNGQENTAPAIHAGLGALLVVVRSHEDQLARVAFGLESLPVVVGDAFGPLQLLAGGQQACAVELRPAIELAGGQFHEVRLEGEAQLDDTVGAVDVVAVGDEVQHHRVAVGLHRAGHLQLLGEGFLRAGQQVVDLLVAGLEADLNMIQAGLFEGGDLLLGEADAGGDQVGVVAQPARFADQLGEVLAYQRLATGKADLRGAHFPRLGHYLEPLSGAQFLALPGEVQRVGTVGALQRAAVGEFGQQPQRQADRHLRRG